MSGIARWRKPSSAPISKRRWPLPGSCGSATSAASSSSISSTWKKDESKEKLYTALEQALKGDRSRTNILRVSELGLVEMTRKARAPGPAVAPDLCLSHVQGQRNRQIGPHAHRGDLFRKIQAGAREGSGREVLIRVYPEMARHLEDEEREGLERLQQLIGRKVVVQGMPAYHREQYDLAFH